MEKNENVNRADYDELADLIFKAFADSEIAIMADQDEGLPSPMNFIVADRIRRIAKGMDDSENFEVEVAGRDRLRTVFLHKKLNKLFWLKSKNSIDQKCKPFEKPLFSDISLTLFDPQRFMIPTIAYQLDEGSLTLRLWEMKIEQIGKGDSKEFAIIEEPKYIGEWLANSMTPFDPDDQHTWDIFDDDEDGFSEEGKSA